jgi:pyruvyltransferase
VGVDLRESRSPRRLLTIARRLVLGSDVATEQGLPYPTVELTYWQPRGWVNFGDELSRTVVSLMLARRGITLQDEARGPRQLLAIGSVVHYARRGAVLWGTGINGDRPLWIDKLSELDVRAVRGPETRRLLIEAGHDVPEVYGDPALLLPELTGDRFACLNRQGIGYVPHLSQMGRLPRVPPGVSVIDPRQSWNRAVEMILSSELVLSSSLHGLIVADAFGIPSRYVRESDAISIFKFDDYYKGTGRPNYRFATSVAEAITLGAEAVPVFDAARLRDAFPYDLWQGKVPPRRD